MRLVTAFDALGMPCVPWSVPDVGVNRQPGRKPTRFAKKDKRLETWQQYVERCARKAMERTSLCLGPIMVRLIFYRKTPPGCRHGDLWTIPVEWNEEKGEYIKQGRTAADCTNLTKGTEDALESVVFGNDGQTCILSVMRLYGPLDGARVEVFEIEPGDFNQGPADDDAPPAVSRPVRVRRRANPSPRRRGGGDGRA